jgi:8-oxo-dGTP diphosphatase
MERPERHAVVAVILRDDKYLMIKRSHLVRAPGQMCFPGGGVEKGETLPEAMSRELKEELGLDGTPVREVWTSVAPSGTHLHWWLTEIDFDQTVRPEPHEVESFSWMSQREILALPNLLFSNAMFFDSLLRKRFSMD